ncbi:phosphatase 2C-like domain-containing protein [Bombardia bombarda]|uniref:Phosphatase 2C-like domain-containing protein n=1 Tax=Bombardia bombarda TaxID=252184 RepID=A0AA39TZS7_9PEZI|nr:phosphatase 2C-like domain-containing protein [Bombardia bombarda]
MFTSRVQCKKGYRNFCEEATTAAKTPRNDALSKGRDGQPPATLLDAFMGYVATFFHSQEQPQMMAKLAMSGLRPLRLVPGGRRHLRAHIRAPTTTAAALLSSNAAGQHDYFRAQSLSNRSPRRNFHNYFVTHLPSSSLHPDSRTTSGLHHKLPRSASVPHTPRAGSAPVVPPNMPSRDLTVVRIPLQKAKHHYGAFNSRGQRGYNEDTHQAGTLDMPAFAKRAPISLVRSQMKSAGERGEGTSADSAFGDPQIFYFAVFDGHGGSECSEFLRDELHGYIEDAATQFELTSSLRPQNRNNTEQGGLADKAAAAAGTTASSLVNAESALSRVEMKSPKQVEPELHVPEIKDGEILDEAPHMPPLPSKDPVPVHADMTKAIQLESELLQEYRTTIGGYFRRFSSSYFGLPARSSNPRSSSHEDTTTTTTAAAAPSSPPVPVSVESVLTYAFLRADLDFITAQARKPDPDDPHIADNFPLNQDEILGSPHLPPSGHGIGGPQRFKGGSTASVALISTPTPAPFWHPAARSTLVVAHVGDTRILLCETATGLPRPLTMDHHPSTPTESRRLRRFAESLVTDSFGEERISGLANSRAFGDMQSKRIGVSAEPDITRVELGPAEYSFLALMSDGVSGSLSDQEIVDVIKEAKTPEEGARHVVEYATERRSEGGLGSLGSKEIRDVRRAEALDPRGRRR